MKSTILRVIVALVLVLSFSLITGLPVKAAANVTPAAGGGAISADTAADAAVPAWTTLGAITIAEGAPGDIDDGVFVLTIAAGFEFNPASAPDVAVTGATPELAANSPAVIDATTITVTVTANSSTEADTMTIGGVTPIQVRPTAGTPLANGYISMTAGTIVGVTGATNFGTLTEVVGAVATLTVVQQPSNAGVGIAITPAITVRATDQFTNNVTGQNIAVALQAGTGALTGISPRVTNASGIATFNDLSIDTAGPGKVLRFSFGGVTVDSNPFTIVVAGITVNPTSLVTSEPGGAATFTIVLASLPAANVTIGLTSSDITEGVVSADNVTFTTLNWNTPQAVTVIVIDDAELDGDIPYVIITAAAVSADANYNNLNASDVSVVNRDDEIDLIHIEQPIEGVTDLSNIVTSGGLFTQDVTVSSGDNNVQLTIEQGTTGQTTTGQPLSQLIIFTLNFPPAPPEQASVIGLTYDFRPDGATFDQPVTITFTYNPDNIPAGVNEEDLTIAFYDDINGEWVVLDNITVDPLTHTISGETTHFTAFAVIAFTQPASFALSDLALSPAEVNVGEVSTISVTINNNGDLSGTYDVILKIDDTVIETKQVTLGGHASQIVNFELSMNAAGIYNVGIGTLSAVLTVKEVPTQTPAPTQAPEVTPTPTPPATPAQTPAPTQGQTPPTTPYPSQPPAQTSAPTPAPVPASGTNWWLIGGIIIGVIVVGGALWFWLAHRRD